MIVRLDSRQWVSIGEDSELVDWGPFGQSNIFPSGNIFQSSMNRGHASEMALCLVINLDSWFFLLAEHLGE
jgi:hypothetical protein